MMERRASLIFVFLSIVASCVFAQDTVSQSVKIPVLNGHQFINNRIVENPFNKTYFQTLLGAGTSTRINLPQITIGDTTIVPTSGSLLFANLGFNFELKLKKGVSYSVRVGGSARIGTDPSSLYTNGLNTVIGITNSWKISLINNDKHYLTSAFGVSTYNAQVINIAKFVQNILQGEEASLTQNISVLRAHSGLSYAYAFGPTTAVQLMGLLIYGDLFEPGKSGGSFNFSGAFEFDLHPKYKVPLGLSMAFARVTMPEYTAAQYNTTTMYNTKLAFTGADSFIISLDATTYTAPYLIGVFAEQSNAETRIYNYSLSMIVYFN